MGASTWASGSQVWNGNIGTLMAKPRKKARKNQNCRSAGTPIWYHSVTSKVPVFAKAGSVMRLEVEGQDAEQHHHRADQGVEEELDGRVEPPRPAPDPDEEVHRDQHDLPEHVEEEHVEGAEDPEHPRLEQEQEHVVLAHALVDRGPAREDRDEAEERRQQDEERADAVDAEEVRDADGRDPVGRSRRTGSPRACRSNQNQRGRLTRKPTRPPRSRTTAPRRRSSRKAGAGAGARPASGV